jgi:hypothetical protein
MAILKKKSNTHTYINIYIFTSMECDYRRVFGLMIGFIGPFVTAHDCTLQFNITHTHTHTLVPTVKSSLAVARQRFPMADVPLPLGSWAIPLHSYQLLTATAHNDWTAAVRWQTHVTHQPTHSTNSEIKIKVKVTLWLAVYRQSVRLGVKLLDTHDQRFFFFDWTLEIIVHT